MIPVSGRKAISLHLGLSLLACLICAAAPLHAATGVLTSVGQVTGLSLVERQRGYRVAIRATVTEYDVFRYRGGEYPNLFVHDNSGGICVRVGDRRFPLRPGDVVDLTGRTAQGPTAPVIQDPEVRLVRHGELPRALPASFPDLESGLRFSDFVEVHGNIRYVYTEGDWATMDLFMDGGVVELQIGRAHV